jgi:vacuolar-type H+-ATPase subunit I/STV1
MARLHFVKKARKNYKEYGIKKGDSYYWWAFRFGGKHMSKDKPRRSQLTQSAFLSTLYEIEDSIADFQPGHPSEIYDFIEDVVSQIEDLKSECENNLDNMPDNLRENSSSGQLLQERIDNLESWISELQSIDTEFDEDSAREDAKIEAEEQIDPDEKDRGDAVSERENDLYEEKVLERIEEILGELQGTSSNC